MAQNPKLALEADMWMPETAHTRHWRCLLFLHQHGMIVDHEFQKVRDRIGTYETTLEINNDHMKEVENA